MIGNFEEHEEYIMLDGVKMEKPFVEKPVNAEDHNVRIYYSRADGGGMKQLFRKEHNQCSEYFPDVSHIRTDGSYIYEHFLQTEGTDVKVYSVGVSYVHAEARKSPTVDGRVDRDENGKEILNLTEGNLATVSCLTPGAPTCHRMAECRTYNMWKGLDEMISDYFSKITLADLAAPEEAGNDYVI